MNDIETLQSLNIPYIIIGIIIIAVVFKFVCEVFDWIIDKTGIEFKGQKQKKDDHALLIQTAKRVEDINKESLEHDKRLEEKIEALTSICIEKQIDDLRWEILDFASALSSGRNYGKEQFDHVLDIHKKYEKILKENNLTNGQVTVSMEVINDIYKDKLKKGF